MANRFHDVQNHWNNPGWNHEHWNGPNGGGINHVGYWGPNGYWGHTGARGPNGGYWGHTGYAGNYGPAGHWARNWGWYNGYGSAWGYGRWNYLWNAYPAAMAFGATMWGLNATAWMFGVGAYYNPYYDGPVYYNDQPVMTYNQPIVGDPGYDENPQVAPDAGSQAAAPADPLTQAFDQARQAFYDQKYDDALNLTNQALSLAPRDAAINEFRSLCLYALGRYRESAATIHAVLAAGPGWDWTTLISLYSAPDVYTAQLRQLEAALNASPSAADIRFLLAYHYLTCGYKDSAVEQLKYVVQLQPRDNLAAELVKMYAPEPETPAAAPNVEPPAPATAPNLEEPAYPLDKLQGDWKARAANGDFALHLGKDDDFVWKFTRDGKPQSVSGAYIVRGSNLVMQPDGGGTMISEIKLTNDRTLIFDPIGDANKLTFTR